MMEKLDHETATVILLGDLNNTIGILEIIIADHFLEHYRVSHYSIYWKYGRFRGFNVGKKGVNWRF